VARSRPPSLTGALAALVAAFALGGCDPFHTGFDEIEGAVAYAASGERAAPDPDAPLRVMNYNVKFGGARIDFFFDCFGDRVLMSRDEVIRNLERLVEKINQYDPDVLVIQEVDVNSKRDAYVDQMQWLLDHTRLRYGVYASQWKADYVPSDGLGAIDSGNGILSKYPLREAERMALAQRTEQSGVERYFYLKRNLLRARLDVPGKGPTYVVAVHADAYSKDGTKRQHIERFKAELDRLAEQGNTVIGVGDLNALPPGTNKQFGFSDSVCEDEEFIADDYREESDWLSSLYADYTPEVPLDVYQRDQASYFSHTVDKDGFWNRKLDYIFTNAEVVPGSGLVHQDEAHGGMETMPLSDHAPVSVELELP
jgi:endonuclease/exonuclease/phosphatase family metal-dependent hydrolase